jgi:hypothetical protein
MWQVKKFDHAAEALNEKPKIALLIFGYCRALETTTLLDNQFIPSALIKLMIKFYPIDEIYCLKVEGDYFSNMGSFYVYLKSVVGDLASGRQIREKVSKQIENILIKNGCVVAKDNYSKNIEDKYSRESLLKPLFTVIVHEQVTLNQRHLIFSPNAPFQTVKNLLDGYFNVYEIPASISQAKVFQYITKKEPCRECQLKPILDNTVSPSF